MTISHTTRFWLAAMTGALVIGIFACSGGGGDPASSGPDDADWKTGTAVSYEFTDGAADISGMIPGAVVTTSSASADTIVIAPVTSGPPLSYTATKIEISCDGAEDMQLTVPKNAGDEIILFSYGALENAAIDGRDGFDGWWSVPAAGQSDTEVTFDLPITPQIATKTAGVSVLPAKPTFAVATLPSGSTEAMKLAAIRTSARQAIDYWLDNLPASIATTARAQVNGDLAYTISWSSDGNAYQHGDNWLSSNANFYFTKDVTLDIIAHEVGHYMTHVLCGYDRYEEIYQRFPTDFWGAGIEHGIGDYREGRLDLLEDYAYFSTYMITDALQAADLEKTPMWTLFKNHKPSDYDYPSHEAYGAAMLGTLLRSEKEVYTFDKKNPKAPAPAVNAPLSDVLGILARGPRDVNELREFISEYLMDRGTDYQYLLPAIMEPLGWSYNGIGMVKYDDDSVVDDATVRAICQTGEGEYRTTISTTTGADGTYLLTRIYPGSNILRVYYNGDKDSTDVPFTVPWEQTTDETLTIPQITIPKEKPREVNLSGTFSGTDELTFKDGNPELMISGSGTWTVKGTDFTIDRDMGDGYIEFKCKPGAKGTITITGSAELSGTTHEESYSMERYVSTFHEPVMLGPIENQNYNFDEGVIQTSSGGGGAITITFEFPASSYWGSLQIAPQFEVRYDTTVYDKNNEVKSTRTDQWWMNYSFCHLYFYVSND